MSDQELRIIAPTAIVGYGFQESSLERALLKDPHLIACDAGSTDPGPNYLGMGKAFVGRDAAKRDLALMLQAAVDRGIPMIIGTSGGAGGDLHLQWTREIVEEIASENNLHFPMALIHSEQTQDYVLRKLDDGRIEPLWPLPPLERDTVLKSTNIVGMAGTEPYIEALNGGAQVVLCGRSDDAAIFAALPIKEEFDPALGWVAGKLLECGAACAVPRQKYGSEGITVTVREDHILVEPNHPGLACTPLSVSTFFLHENETPIQHTEPSGVLDLSALECEALDDRTVKITGAQFLPREKYTIRLEGVELVGYRCICVSLTRDPVLSAVHRRLPGPGAGAGGQPGGRHGRRPRRIPPDLPGCGQRLGDGRKGTGEGGIGPRVGRHYGGGGPDPGPGQRNPGADPASQQEPALRRQALRRGLPDLPLLAIGHSRWPRLPVQHPPRRRAGPPPGNVPD